MSEPKLPSSVSSGPIYRGMDREALDIAYNNTAHIGQNKRDHYVNGWISRSRSMRATRPGKTNVRYGRGERQRLDVLTCGERMGPTAIYIHGGYWQSNDKEWYTFLEEGIMAAGCHAVFVEYTLGPEARITDIVAEVRVAVAWVIEHAEEWGGDPCRCFAAGHSAGGHLVAMAMEEERLAGGLAISGIFDLEPIRLNYLNEKLQMDAEEALLNSPIHHLPKRSAPLMITVGLGELPELVRQSSEYAAAWLGRGLPGRFLPLEKHDHFSILEELGRADGAVVSILRDLVAS